MTVPQALKRMQNDGILWRTEACEPNFSNSSLVDTMKWTAL